MPHAASSFSKHTMSHPAASSPDNLHFLTTLNSHSEQDCVKVVNIRMCSAFCVNDTPIDLPLSRSAAARLPRIRSTTMNAIMDTALDLSVGKLRRSSLLTSDLDYHVIRASMVI